jgi:hypothetical protein
MARVPPPPEEEGLKRSQSRSSSAAVAEQEGLEGGGAGLGLRVDRRGKRVLSDSHSSFAHPVAFLLNDLCLVDLFPYVVISHVYK